MRKKRYAHYLPKGWTLMDVQEVLEYYENQTPEEAALEDEAIPSSEEEILMTVPRNLVPRVRKMIAEQNRRERRIISKDK